MHTHSYHLQRHFHTVGFKLRLVSTGYTLISSNICGVWPEASVPAEFLLDVSKYLFVLRLKVWFCVLTTVIVRKKYWWEKLKWRQDLTRLLSSRLTLNQGHICVTARVQLHFSFTSASQGGDFVIVCVQCVFSVSVCVYLLLSTRRGAFDGTGRLAEDRRQRLTALRLSDENGK